jgi:hypothetical protein
MNSRNFFEKRIEEKMAAAGRRGLADVGKGLTFSGRIC